MNQIYDPFLSTKVIEEIQSPEDNTILLAQLEEIIEELENAEMQPSDSCMHKIFSELKQQEPSSI